MGTIEKKITECPVCNGKVLREVREKTIVYKGKSCIIHQPGIYCDNCKDEYLLKEDVLATRREIADFKRRVDKYLTSDEIIAFRKQFGLSQKNASNLLGGGPMAFSKYERGVITQNKAVDILMRLLRAGKITLEDLEF